MSDLGLTFGAIVSLYYFGFTSFQKINFSKISHLNALGSKFDLDVK